MTEFDELPCKSSQSFLLYHFIQVYGKKVPGAEKKPERRPGTAPSGLLRKESNLVDKPQRIAKGDMASSVAVKKGGFAEAIKSGNRGITTSGQYTTLAFAKSRVQN